MSDPGSTIGSTIARLETALVERATEARSGLDDWDPPLCGDIDILIRSDGSWWHEGRRIRRQALTDLFSTILRREGDGGYYLVTPVEKWRVRVETHPLQVVDISADLGTTPAVLRARCATGQQLCIGEAHPLAYSPGEQVPHLCCKHGLTASLARPVWYRLAEEVLQQAQHGQLQVVSGSYRFGLRTDLAARNAL